LKCLEVISNKLPVFEILRQSGEIKAEEEFLDLVLNDCQLK